MRRRLETAQDRLWVWVWGGVGVVVVAAVAFAFLRDGGDDAITASDGFGITAAVIDHLGQHGTPTGEGLTRPELTASSGKTDTADGGAQVPRGTVDGPGRRIFGGVTVRLPAGKTPFVLRQILPEDVDGASGSEGAFVLWAGWVAVLTPEQTRSATLPGTLSWQKAAEAGVTVPAGSTVRLRTMFRIADTAGACEGEELVGEVDGHRALETLRRAPAWLVRPATKGAAWQWLRVDDASTPGLSVAVRSGPTRPVLFRGSHVCVAAQSVTETDPDPDPLGGAVDDAGGKRLPFDAPDGY